MYILQCNYIKYLTNVSLNAKKIDTKLNDPFDCFTKLSFCISTHLPVKVFGKIQKCITLIAV